MASERAVPVWFGPEESPLFGALHLPEVPTRGLVVLCPPLGREYLSAHATFLELAVRLARLGLAALRLDYHSTGDSFDRTGEGSEGSDFVHDIGAAVEFARTMGITNVAIVGMRLGASFAALRCRVDPVEALVLWDPCSTGQSFLREQRTLGLLAGVRSAEEGSGAFELPGFKLSAEMTSEVLGVDLLTEQGGLAGTEALAGKVLLLTRAERVADAKIAERLGGADLEHREVTGQPALLDVHPLERAVPAEALGMVTSWLDDVMPRHGLVITAPSEAEVKVRICVGDPSSDDPEGEESVLVRERAVSLGPVGLFAIETEPERRGLGPACIFVSVANDHRIGPGRLWVQLSRRLAAAGFRCVRFDVNGYGDSPPREPGQVHAVLSVLGIDDVVDAARAVSPDDPGDVVLCGLSASGYHVLEAALSLTPRGICVVNPMLVFRAPEMAAGGPMDDRRQFCLPRTALAYAFATAARDQSRIQWLDQRLRTLTSRLPKPLRKLVWRLRRGARPKNKPGERLGELVAAGTDVLLICGPDEIQPFLETGLGAISRAEHDGRLQIEVIPTLGHALLFSKDRDMVSELILDHVLARFRPPAGDVRTLWPTAKTTAAARLPSWLMLRAKSLRRARLASSAA